MLELYLFTAAFSQALVVPTSHPSHILLAAGHMPSIPPSQTPLPCLSPVRGSRLQQAVMLASKKSRRKSRKENRLNAAKPADPTLSSNTEPVGVPDMPTPLLVQPITDNEAFQQDATPLSSSSVSGRSVVADELGDIVSAPAPDNELLKLIKDETKISLPEQFKSGQGSANETPVAIGRSKLPSINPGKPAFDPSQKPEKTPFEKFVFRGTWGGIAGLVLIEIFINTPAFEQYAKPAILQFLDSQQ